MRSRRSCRRRESIANTDGHAEAKALRALAHRTLADVSNGIERLRFNTAIAKLYTFVGALAEIADKPEAARQRCRSSPAPCGRLSTS